MPQRPSLARSLAALVLVGTFVSVASAGATLGRQSAPADAAAGTAVTETAVTAASSGIAFAPGGAVRPLVSIADDGPSAVRDDPRDIERPYAPIRTVDVPAGGGDWIQRAETDTPEPRARTTARDEDTGGSGSAAEFSGRNRVWIPSLGIRRSVSGFACSSSAYPGDRVYRWGCAGRNNIYLFGHAHSVFKPLHDAYVRGRLAKGMKVHYADGAGRVSTYSVIWWKVTTPDKGDWAYAGQSRPSMTLQTCVGANSQFRLVVRLAKTG
jgi:hypothetical protein